MKYLYKYPPAEYPSPPGEDSGDRHGEVAEAVQKKAEEVKQQADHRTEEKKEIL